MAAVQGSERFWKYLQKLIQEHSGENDPDHSLHAIKVIKGYASFSLFPNMVSLLPDTINLEAQIREVKGWLEKAIQWANVKSLEDELEQTINQLEKINQEFRFYYDIPPDIRLEKSVAITHALAMITDLLALQKMKWPAFWALGCLLAEGTSLKELGVLKKRSPKLFEILKKADLIEIYENDTERRRIDKYVGSRIKIFYRAIIKQAEKMDADHYREVFLGQTRMERLGIKKKPKGKITEKIDPEVVKAKLRALTPDN